jgi:membrane-anchored protein YejM (alkaline phosphatase superfamily)
MTSSAVGYGSPTLIDRTVFAGVTGLKPESSGSGVAKNRAVTADWLNWLDARQDTAPFFAFLYYDPPVTDGTSPGSLAADNRYATNKKAQTRWQQYRRGVHTVDAEVARVLDALEAAGLQDNTLVMITSDHGYEFDDLGLGYYGHASNFGPPQLRATLLMRWPGRLAHVYEHRSSHMDLPATLLEGLLGCTNPPADYLPVNHMALN